MAITAFTGPFTCVKVKSGMDVLFAIFLGVSLSAAAGFRVFIPPLVMSLAARYGVFELPPDAAWLASTSALVIFAVATFLEVGSFYVPLVDNLLDALAVPAAFTAGTLITNLFLPELSPAMQWVLAAALGGSAAGGIQGLMTVTRLASTGITAGLGNPVVATVENIGAFALSALALLVPVLAFGLVVFMLAIAFRRVYRFMTRRRNKPSY